MESPRQPRPGSIRSKLPSFRRRRPRRHPADTTLVAFADTGDKPPILRVRSRVRRGVIGSGLLLLVGAVFGGSVAFAGAGAAVIVLEPALWLTGLWLLPASIRARAVQSLIDAEAVELSRRWLRRRDLRVGVRQEGRTGRSLRARTAIGVPRGQSGMRIAVTDGSARTRSWPTRSGGVAADYQPVAVFQAGVRPGGSGEATDTVVELAIVVRYGQDDAFYLLDRQARRLSSLPCRQNRRRKWERLALGAGIEIKRYRITADGMYGAKKIEEALFPRSIHYRAVSGAERERRTLRSLLNGVGLSPHPRLGRLLQLRPLRRIRRLRRLRRNALPASHTPE